MPNPTLFYIDQDEREEALKALRVDMDDPTSHSDSPLTWSHKLNSKVDVLWARSSVQFILDFTEHGSLY